MIVDVILRWNKIDTRFWAEALSLRVKFWFKVRLRLTVTVSKIYLSKNPFDINKNCPKNPALAKIAQN